jgi:hypothetical protein
MGAEIGGVIILNQFPKRIGVIRGLFQPRRLDAVVKTSRNGKLTLAFTNYTGLSFSVLATNNLAAPIATWPLVGHPIESPAGSGNYHFTNSPATNGQFYILRQP